MLWKCCTQYARKFGKLISDHGTGKRQFSFQSLRIAMPKNAQTTVQLHSSHMLLNNAENSPCQASTIREPWNFRCSNLDLEKAEEPEIKLPTSTGSSKKQESSRKKLYLFYWLCQSHWLLDDHKLWKFVKKMGIPDHLTCLLRNLYVGQEATVRNGHGTTDRFQRGKGICQGHMLSDYLNYLI